MLCPRNGRRPAHSHDSFAEVFARFYLAVRRSSVQPSLLRLLTKVQAGTHIEFFPKREVSNASFSFFRKQKWRAYFSGKLTAARRVAGDGGFRFFSFHQIFTVNLVGSAASLGAYCASAL
jgi:hypothetical protein